MRLALASVLTLWIAALWPAAAGQQRPRTPSLAIDSLTGRDSFTFYCASCHGQDGRGNGPTAAALNVRTADLTTLARRSGGSFPRSQIEAFVIGTERPIPAHGTGEMPVWGPIFRSLDPSDTRARIRIANLVEYLESIQAK